MSLWFSQYQTVLWKCFLINFRGRQFIKQSVIVIILGSIICVIENFQSNNFITPFYLAISVLGYSRYSAMSWVSQKETRQKQLQKIMGISQVAYLFGWLTYFILNGLFITIIMLLFLVFGVIRNGKTNFEQGYTWINIALIFFLYTIAVIGFTMTLSTFFNRAKTAAQASSFIQLIGSLLFFLRFSQDFDKSRPLILLSAILPQQAFNMGILKIAFLDSGFANFTPDFSYEQGCYALAFDAIFFLIFSIYLDQVWPNQIGTQKHPLFFISWIWRRNATRKNHEKNPLMDQFVRVDEQLQSQSFGNESSAKYEQSVQRNSLPLIKMKDVDKQFGNKKAVNNLTLNFYQKEIFCLLGHNGAGKSTTINILTGMLEHNRGSIQLLGMNYNTNLTEIRTNIGLCLQYNVLYDLLSIQQHLLYYAQIKGKTKQEAQPQIQRVIVKCALDGQRGKLAKNLSGGNKRKLCLANALIGQSKLIFLDQPSSGLDPNSRRAIWDIMKSLTQENRCVILTTHHLQQAEALAQRIGIMSQGKLVIVGDCSFIKQKFNVGYHLIVTLNRQNQQQNLNKCKQIVHRNFKVCKQDQQTASNTVKFILGENQVQNFAQGFQQLQKANVGQLTLNVSNLEDAFIKLGTQETEGQGIVPDIPDVELPNVACRYSYKRQFRAVFTKKALITLRTVSSLFSLLLPVIFIIAGFIVAVVVINGSNVRFQWLKLYIMSYFMTLAFAFNTSAYCGSIVLDREKKFKYLSNVMGLRKLPYWTANYAFDSLIFLVPLVPFFVLMYIVEEAAFLRQVMYLLIPLLIVFCLAFIGYSYFFSFIFQKSNTAYRLFPILNFVFFLSVLQIPQFIDRKSFIAIYVTPIISPFIAFSNAFQTKEFLGNQDFEALGLFVANLPVCFIGLTFQAILFPILTLFMESIRFNLKDKQQLEEHQQQINVQEERKSIEEQMRRQKGMRNSSSIGTPPILIDHLYKKYPNGYIAIRDNSFRVAQKQIFGLLGPNGAGKSTTFNIVTAALPKTSGKVQILGQDVNRGIMQIFQNVGVCPQYDALYEMMTTQQHMKYFARLKGLSEQQIKNTLSFYYQLLSLTPFVKVKSQNLSGGNKRKLCVSMAMLANPSIMFYDQPSAGVDPISRRYLWKALSLSVKNFNTSMVLTTHSMNQAESLCNRIGILIKGRFIALDTPKNLTLKYGKGFRIQVYCKQEDKKEQIKKNFMQQFGNQINIQDIPQSNNLGLLFVIPSPQFNLSSAYGLCQNRLLTKYQSIVRYHIAQSTLEEVFIHLSRMQPQVLEQQQYKQPWQCLCWEFGATGCMCLV